MKIITPQALISAIFLFFCIQLSYAAPININTADAATMAKSLSGIGTHKATAIIHYRQKHGFFKKPADIVKVRGIGKGTYIKNRMDIAIN